MFEQTFKNIDDILHKDAGCSSELDYVEQTRIPPIKWTLGVTVQDFLEILAHKQVSGLRCA